MDRIPATASPRSCILLKTRPPYVLNRYSRILVAQAIGIQIAYSACLTLYVTGMRTYTRFMYSQTVYNT